MIVVMWKVGGFRGEFYLLFIKFGKREFLIFYKIRTILGTFQKSSDSFLQNRLNSWFKKKTQESKRLGRHQRVRVLCLCSLKIILLLPSCGTPTTHILSDLNLSFRKDNHIVPSGYLCKRGEELGTFKQTFCFLNKHSLVHLRQLQQTDPSLYLSSIN